MIFLSKKKSKRMARQIAEKYSGSIQSCYVSFGVFSTCHYKITFTYKKMRVEAYPFWPYIQLWVQNFNINQDINFSVANENSTFDLTKSLHNFATKHYLTVSSHKAYDLTETKRFCQCVENEQDMFDLQLRKGEYLCISRGQIVLQSKHKQCEDLSVPIDILARIFERNVAL